MIAYDARFYSSQERDDDKVDEEDDGESEEQRCKAFHCAAIMTI